MTSAFSKDIANAKAALVSLPCDWDGKKSVLALKEADYNWKQMEWWAFFFEHLCHQRLATTFEIPGEMIGSVRFDIKGPQNLPGGGLTFRNAMTIARNWTRAGLEKRVVLVRLWGKRRAVVTITAPVHSHGATS